MVSEQVVESAAITKWYNLLAYRKEVVMVTKNTTRDFIFRQIENLSQDGLIEVAQFIEFLQFREQSPLQASAVMAGAAFGIWADYPEAQNPAAFAADLRHRMERRNG